MRSACRIQRASGLSEAANFLPYLTCSDLSMPGMSGFELASALRLSSHSCNTYLIATTGLSTDENLREVKEAGFDTYFIKPFNFEEFIAHVHSVFARA
ncbi:response regulator [Oxalobacteraceae sp. CFBP 13730]|nr:response regulator [Oxalobacteraceae sp. CFBP 13730]